MSTTRKLIVQGEWAVSNDAGTVAEGRLLRAHGWPERAETVVVMLDGACSFQHLDPEAL